MVQRPSAFLVFKSIGTGAALWLSIGVPVAAVLAASRVSLWVVAAVPAMAATAFVLGIVHGFWLCLLGPLCESGYNSFLLLGSILGAFLGALGFLPVLSSTGLIASRPTAAVFLVAAVLGGIAAGLTTAHVLYLSLLGSVSTTRRRSVVGLTLILLAVIDYQFYWPMASERIAVPEVSRRDITSLTAGNARGSRWTGCYKFEGKFPLKQGGASGFLRVSQTNGVLTVGQAGDSLLGRVDRDGRFRFGAEITKGMDTLRVLWEGTFHNNFFDFSRRLTIVNGVNTLGVNPLKGTAQMISCQ